MNWATAAIEECKCINEERIRRRSTRAAAPTTTPPASSSRVGGIFYNIVFYIT